MPLMTWAGERLAPLWTTLGTAAVTAALLGVGPAPPLALAAIGVTLCALACRVPGEGLRLAGPVAVYELVRAARGGRPFALRTLVGLGVLFLIWTQYATDTHRAGGRTPGDAARFGARVAASTLGGLWVAVPLAVLAVTPGAVAEGRERGRLDLTLVTDLRGRELVFGRLLAALAGAGTLALVAVPVLALLPLFGGVDPAVIACSLALLCSTALAVAGVAALAGASARNPGEAIWWAGAVLASYALVSSVAVTALPGLLLSPWRALLAANPLAGAWLAVLPGGGASAREAWALARPVLAAQGAVFLIAAPLAVTRLRAAAAGSAAPPARRSAHWPPLGRTPPLTWRDRAPVARACPSWLLLGLALLVLTAVWMSIPRGPVREVFVVRFTGTATLALHLLVLGRAVARRLDDDRHSGMADLIRLADVSGTQAVAQRYAAAWRGGARPMLVALAVFWSVAAAAKLIAWWAVPVLIGMTAAAQDATVSLAIALGVRRAGHAARAVTGLWVAFVAVPTAFVGVTAGLSLCLNPAAGVLVWASDRVDVDRASSEIRLLMAVHAILAMVIPFAAWRLRRWASGRVRPLVVRPSE